MVKPPKRTIMIKPALHFSIGLLNILSVPIKITELSWQHLSHRICLVFKTEKIKLLGANLQKNLNFYSSLKDKETEFSNVISGQGPVIK